MEILRQKSNTKDICFILVGTLLMAIAINMIYDPMELITGGVTGVGIIIKHFFGVPVWLTNILFNIPLFLISFKVYGFRYIAKTLTATLSLTFFIYIIPGIPITNDLLLAALFGGALSGVGIGLVLVTMSTTGGTDMLGMLIHRKRPDISVPQLLLVIDGAIVLAGAITFGIDRALYAIIAVYVVTKVSDGLMDGLKFAKCAYIVSDRYEDIAKDIMQELDRGVTALEGTGMYSGNSKKVLFCVASKKEMVHVLDIVHKNDTAAFVTIHDVREVCGEGFTEKKT